MENNYETLRMPGLRALARVHALRGYCRLRKAELITFLQNNERRAQSRQQRPQQMSTWEPNQPLQMSTWEPELEWENEVRQPELEALTKRQLRCRQNKDSKLAKKFKNLEKENDNLKSQMEALEDKITKASKSANARFKRKKIRSMGREADKIAEKLRESKKALNC